MTGLIMEIKEQSVIVMTAEGAFEEWQVETAERSIGEELSKPNEKSSVIDLSLFAKRGGRRLAGIAAALAVAIGLSGTGAWAYFTPTGFINIDINPSIEMAYNMFERIIDVKAINEDGKIVISSTANIKNRKISQAISEIIEVSKDIGFIEDDSENYVLITNSSDELVEEVEAEINDAKFAGEAEGIIVETLQSDMANFEKSSEQGVSPGKKILVEKAKELKIEDVTTDTNLGQILKIIRIEESNTQKQDDIKQEEKDNNQEEKQEDKDIKQEEKQEEKDNKQEEKQEDKDIKQEEKQEDKDNKQEDKQEEKDSKQEEKQEDKDNKQEKKQEDKDIKQEEKQEEKDSKQEEKQKEKDTEQELKQEEKDSKQDEKQEEKDSNQEDKDKKEKNSNGKGGGNKK